MKHHTTHDLLSRPKTMASRSARAMVGATVALLCLGLMLQAVAAPAQGAGPEGAEADCRVRFAIMTLREGPGFAYAPIRPPLKRDTPLTAVGRSEKPNWLLVETEKDAQGWALLSQLRCDPLGDLPEVEAPPEPKPTRKPRRPPVNVDPTIVNLGEYPAMSPAPSPTTDGSLTVPDVPDILPIMPYAPDLGLIRPTPTPDGP